MCALTEMEPTITDNNSRCAGERSECPVDGFWMAAKISAERDSSAANSVSFQIAAVYGEARSVRTTARATLEDSENIQPTNTES